MVAFISMEKLKELKRTKKGKENRQKLESSIGEILRDMMRDLDYPLPGGDRNDLSDYVQRIIQTVGRYYGY